MTHKIMRRVCSRQQKKHGSFHKLCQRTSRYVYQTRLKNELFADTYRKTMSQTWKDNKNAGYLGVIRRIKLD